MNRQAKRKSDNLCDRDWHDMGSVTFIDAAQKFAEWLDSQGWLFDWQVIQVRDSDQPNVVHEFVVERQVNYVVKKQRQGAE